MIWLIGNRGMLGQELSAVLAARGMAFVGSDREVDIRDIGALRGFARDALSKAGGTAEPIRWVINCSAYTAVDKAEEEEEIARSINAAGAANIATAATELGARMIHVSTDYVFRGDGKAPYLESDPMDPAGAYGRTKAEGERLVAAACPEHYIVRTAWLYGKYGPNFVYTMLKLMKSKESISVVSDQKGTPTWAYDLACAMADIVAKDSGRYGTYHFTNEGQTDWHGFAMEIHRLGREFGILDRDCGVAAITSDQYPSKVKRPAWSVLSKEKIRRELGVDPPEWKASLRAYLKGLSVFLDDARDLRNMADYDMETARAMLATGRFLYVAYTCQQCLEKSMKSLLVVLGKARKIHNLVGLASDVALPIDDGERALLANLTEFYLKGRYPSYMEALMRRLDGNASKSLLEGTEKLCEKIRKHPAYSIL